MTLHYEIVTVLDAARLIDCESYERRYSTPDGSPLAPGHYVVVWDESVETPGFNEDATYIGPYKSSWVAAVTIEGFPSSAPAHASGEDPAQIEATV